MFEVSGTTEETSYIYLQYGNALPEQPQSVGHSVKRRSLRLF